MSLFWKSEDTDWIVMQAFLDILQGQASISDGREQQGKRLFDAGPRRSLLSLFHADIKRGSVDSKSINHFQVIPDKCLVIRRRERFQAGAELVLREEQDVHADVARDLESLRLAELDQQEVFFVLHVADVDATIMERSGQQDGCEVGALGIGNDRLVNRPGGKVSRDDRNLRDNVSRHERDE